MKSVLITAICFNVFTIIGTATMKRVITMQVN